MGVEESHDFWIQESSSQFNRNRCSSPYSNNGIQFCSDTEESGTSSPRLWSPVENSQSLSPNSRIQAIAKGQRELMEMIKSLPESSYELSLKDLVQDLPGLTESREEEDDGLSAAPKVVEKGNDGGRRKVVVKRQESKKLLRTASLDNNGGNGLLLKMVFPVSFRGTSRRKKAAVPRPDCLDNKSSKGNSFERDNWWKKRYCSSTSSSHGSRSSGSGSDSNNNNSSSNQRKMSNFLPYCCSSSLAMAMTSERAPK